MSFFHEVFVMKPCPFCGSDDVGYSYREHPDGRELSFIACGNCGASGPVRTYACIADDDESEAAWDKSDNAIAQGRAEAGEARCSESPGATGYTAFGRDDE